MPKLAMGNLLGGLDRKPSNWWRFSVAILAPAIALLIKLLLAPAIEQESPFVLFYAAVLASARYGGIRAGLLASVLSALISDYFFLSPKYLFINQNSGQNLQLVMFLIESIAICEVVASLKLAKRRAEQSKKEALQHQDISRQAEERFRLLVEGVKDYAIFMLDPAGYIISWNTGAAKIKGYQANEIIGQHFSCFYTCEDIECDKPVQELHLAAVEERFEDKGWRVLLVIMELDFQKILIFRLQNL